ncbi:hypothetical protein ACO0QE_002181 [Hanseniaspora vineae]
MADNILTFENLVQVDSILQKVTSLLSIDDFLSLQQANKYICQRCQKLKIEENKYTQYFKQWRIPVVETEDALVDQDLPFRKLNEINAFQEIKEVPDKQMKPYFVFMYETFEPYIKKLSNNQINSKFFSSTQDPINQANILNNILKFNAINKTDATFFQQIKERYDILKDIFVNSILKELESSHTSSATKRKFISVLLVLHEYNISIDYFKSLSDFQTDVLQDVRLFSADGNANSEIDIIGWSQFWVKLSHWFNSNIKICDELFEDDYPVIINFAEDIINENILRFVKTEFEGLNIQFFDRFYQSLQTEFIDKLQDSKNAGGSQKLKEMISQFIILYFEPFITSFTSFLVNRFHEQVSTKLTNFSEQVATQELKQNEQLYETIQKQYEQRRLEREEYLDNKNNFLRSFQQILKINNNKLDKLEKQNLEVEFNLNKMNKSLENIKSLIDLNLCMEAISLAKTDISKILSFKKLGKYENTIIIEKNCENIFKILITELQNKHVSPAFEKTLELLKKNNEEINTTNLEAESFQTSEPLIKFTELINIGDVIIQLIAIFFKNEILEQKIIRKKDNNDFLNDVIKLKKDFETQIDDFVAEGLHIGINKLMIEVEYVFNSTQLPTDYNPDGFQAGQEANEDVTHDVFVNNKTALFRDVVPSACCLKVVELIKNYCFLLDGVTAKGTIEVYQEEIGDRFFQSIVKNLMKNLISKNGAIYLICDINYYYTFVSEELKLKKVLPLFESLKCISQLFLIDGNGKELGKMICDSSRYNGIFTQEEVYEFVTRRSDWHKVKRQVDKTIYGLDCVIQ